MCVDFSLELFDIQEFGLPGGDRVMNGVPKGPYRMYGMECGIVTRHDFWNEDWPLHTRTCIIMLQIEAMT